MIRIICAAAIVATIILLAYGMITIYDESLQIGRMWETPAIRPHEEAIPVMADVSVPMTGGEAFYRNGDPDTMHPPFDLTQPHTIAAGKQGYQFYCIQCHGKHFDGYGTVGQSFAPPPGDLRSVRVQDLPPGRLFHEISYGIPGGRQPALATTVSEVERWQIIGYVRSLGAR